MKNLRNLFGWLFLSTGTILTGWIATIEVFPAIAQQSASGIKALRIVTACFQLTILGYFLFEGFRGMARKKRP